MKTVWVYSQGPNVHESSTQLNRSNLKLWRYGFPRCLVSSSRFAHSHSWPRGWLRGHRGPTSMIPEKNKKKKQRALRSSLYSFANIRSLRRRKHFHECILLFYISYRKHFGMKNNFRLFQAPPYYTQTMCEVPCIPACHIINRNDSDWLTGSTP